MLQFVARISQKASPAKLKQVVGRSRSVAPRGDAGRSVRSAPRDHAAGRFALDHDGARRRRRTRERDGLDDAFARRGYLEQLGADLIVRQSDQRGRDFGLLVEFVRQALGGGKAATLHTVRATIDDMSLTSSI